MSVGCVAALVLLGLSILLAVLLLVAIVGGYAAESRRQRQRITERQVLLDAEDALRANAQASMRAMLDAVRQHNGRQ